MNFACQNCHNLIAIMPGERPPPWCSKCGADFKSDDPRLVNLFDAPREELSRPQEPRAARVPTGRTRAAMPPVAPPMHDEEVGHAEGVADEPELVKHHEADGNLGVKVLIGAGVLFILAGIGLGAQQYQWVRECGTADGVVVATSTLNGRGARLVKYTVGEKAYEFPQADAPVGEVVTVIHRQDNPSDGQIWDPVKLYRWPGVFGLVGLGALVIGVSALALRSSPESRPVRAA